MFKIQIEFSDNSKKIVNIEKPELIYGATAVIIKDNYKKDIYGINPVTKDKLIVLEGDEDRIVVPLHSKRDYNLAKKYNLPKQLAVMPYFVGEGESKIRENVNTVKRHSLIAMIEDEITGAFLCEDSQNGKYRSFVQGGIERGETIEQAAKREILEETGYKDVVIEKINEIPVINHFFAAYKGNNSTNRFAKLEIVYGKIKSLEREEISEEEKLKHKVKWIPKEELREFININHNLYALNTFLRDDNVFEGDGIIISNDENNEKKSLEVREDIIKRYGMDLK